MLTDSMEEELGGVEGNINACLFRMPLVVVEKIASTQATIEALRVFEEWVRDYDGARWGVHQWKLPDWLWEKTMSVLSPIFMGFAIEDGEFRKDMNRGGIGHDFWFLPMSAIKQKLSEALQWVRTESKVN